MVNAVESHLFPVTHVDDKKRRHTHVYNNTELIIHGYVSPMWDIHKVVIVCPTSGLRSYNMDFITQLTEVFHCYVVSWLYTGRTIKSAFQDAVHTRQFVVEHLGYEEANIVLIGDGAVGCGILCDVFATARRVILFKPALSVFSLISSRVLQKFAGDFGLDSLQVHLQLRKFTSCPILLLSPLGHTTHGANLHTLYPSSKHRHVQGTTIYDVRWEDVLAVA